MKIRRSVFVLIGFSVGATLAWRSPSSDVTEMIERNVQASEVAAIPPSSEVSAAARYDALMALPEGTPNKWWDRELLLYQWAAEDPEEAAAHLAALGHSPVALFEAWAALDPAKALKAALTITDPDWRLTSFYRAAAVAAEVDAEMFLTFCQDMPDDCYPAEGILIAFEDVASRDLERALAAEAGLEGRVELAARKAIARAWARQDPEGALEWAEISGERTLEEKRVRLSALLGISESDPARALELLSPMIDEKTVSGYFRDSWYDEEVKAMIEHLASKDAVGALEWVQKHLGMKSSLTRQTAKWLPRDDVEWTSQWLRDSNMRGEWWKGICDAWSTEEIGKLADAVLTKENDHEARSAVLWEWGKQAFPDAWAYTDAIVDPERKRLAKAMVLGALSTTMQWKDAEAYSQELVSDWRTALPETWQGVTDEEVMTLSWQGVGQFQDARTLASNTAWRLGIRDPERAVRWAGEHALADQLGPAIREPMKQWADRSPEEASQWLAELPPSALRDQAALAMIHAVAKFDPEGADAWISEIESSPLREEAAGVVQAAWERLSTGGLPE